MLDLIGGALIAAFFGYLAYEAYTVTDSINYLVWIFVGMAVIGFLANAKRGFRQIAMAWFFLRRWR